MSVFASPHFTWIELACHDGSEIPDAVRPALRMLCNTVLEPLRARWGGPIVIVSGYRTEEWNKRVGGAPKSQHVRGTAADIRPVSLTRVQDLRLLIEDMIRDGELQTLGGLGAYKGWIHVDVRPKGSDGHLARWAGRGVGSEESA